MATGTLIPISSSRLGKILPISLLGPLFFSGTTLVLSAPPPTLKIQQTEIIRQPSISQLVSLSALGEIAFFVTTQGTYLGKPHSAVGEIWVNFLKNDQCQKVADVDPMEGLEVSPSGRWMAKITYDQHPRILLIIYGNTSPKIREIEIPVLEDYRADVVGWSPSEHSIIYGVAPPTGTHSETEDSWKWSQAEWTEVDLLTLKSHKVDLEKMKPMIVQFVKEHSKGYRSPDPPGIQAKRFPKEKKLEWWIEEVKVFETYTPDSAANGLIEPHWVSLDADRLLTVQFQPASGSTLEEYEPENLRGEYSLWEVSLKEKTSKRLVRNVALWTEYLEKSPSGRFLVYEDRRGSLWARDLKTGAAAVLYYHPPGFEYYWSLKPVWTSEADVYFAVPLGKGKEERAILMKAHLE